MLERAAGPQVEVVDRARLAAALGLGRALVAGSVGPLGVPLEPLSALSFDEAIRATVAWYLDGTHARYCAACIANALRLADQRARDRQMRILLRYRP